MKKNNLKRFLASLLAVLMLASVTGVSPAVFALDETGTTEPTESTGTVAPEFKGNTGEVLIKSDYDSGKILDALAKAFLANYSDLTEEQIAAINWTYKYAVKGTYIKLGVSWPTYETDEAREAKVPVLTGLTVTESYCYYNGWPKDLYADATYVYPALAANTDGTYELYANGESVGTINKVAKLKSSINVNNEVATIAIPYTSGTEYDVNALNESIFNAYVTSTTPAGLTYDKFSYTGTVAEGQQTITISYAGNDDYNGTSKDVTVKFVDGRNVAFTAKEQPKTLSIGYVGNKIDVATTENNVRKQLVTVVAEDVKLDQVKVEFRNTTNIFNDEDYQDLNLAAIEFYRATETDIRLTYAGDATHKPFTKIFENIKFADNRVASSIVLKENASITYNKEKGAMKQDIFDNAIDWEATKLPEGITKDDLTFECNTSLVPKITVWGDIDGKEYPNLDAGDAQKIRISFVGNSDFKPGEFEFTIKVAKAHVDVSMKKFATAYAGDEEALSKEALNVALDPNDPRIDIYMVFAGINTNFDGSVNLVLTDDQWKVIKNISAAEKEIYNAVGQIFPEYKDRPTLQEKLEDGITIGEFKQYINDLVTVLEKVASVPGVDNIFKHYNIDIDSIRAMVNIFEAIDFADDTTIAFGVPKHAGLYRAYAIAVNKNYEPNYATGTVLILMNWKNIKIVPNADLKKQTITVSEAEKYASGELAAATLLNKSTGESSGIDQSALHYRFTGLNKIYSSHDFPTAPGKYIVTVSVRGGDYYALPTTFTFTVKAD